MQKSTDVESLGVTINIIGNKWRPLIIHSLRHSVLRFTQLKQQLPAITHKTLSLELKQLERAGIIRRVLYPQIPPRVEYSLTIKGMSLIPLVDSMRSWGELNRQSYTPLNMEYLQGVYRLYDYSSMNEHSSPSQV